MGRGALELPVAPPALIVLSRTACGLTPRAPASMLYGGILLDPFLVCLLLGLENCLFPGWASFHQQGQLFLGWAKGTSPDEPQSRQSASHADTVRRPDDPLRKFTRRFRLSASRSCSAKNPRTHVKVWARCQGFCLALPLTHTASMDSQW